MEQMTLTVTDYFLDTYVAPQLSQLTRADMDDMSNFDPEQASWVANYILNTAFRASYAEGQRQLAMAFLRRAEYAFNEYEAARRTLSEYLAGERHRASRYYQSLLHFETFVSQAYQAYMTVRKLVRGPDPFKSGDGSVHDRLNILYNFVKHSEDKISDGHYPTGAIVPIWMTNEGIVCVKCRLAYSEMADLLRDIGKAARLVVDPPAAMVPAPASKPTHSAPESIPAN